MATNKPKESQPASVKPNKDVDLNTVGIRPITTFKDIPKVKSITADPATGKKITVFDTDAGETGVTMDTLQPFLTEEEVKKIGIYKWRLYRTKPDKIYTTVVNSRRFKLHEKLFLDLKDKGLVILVD